MRPKRNASEYIRVDARSCSSTKASMRPKRNASEYHFFLAVFLDHNNASMRPKRNASEYYTGRKEHRLAYRSFNEAEA